MCPGWAVTGCCRHKDVWLHECCMSAPRVSAMVLRLCTSLWHSCTPKVTPVVIQVSCSLNAASCPWD